MWKSTFGNNDGLYTFCNKDFLWDTARTWHWLIVASTGKERYVIVKVRLPANWSSHKEWMEAAAAMKAEAMKDDTLFPKHVIVVGGGMNCKWTN